MNKKMIDCSEEFGDGMLMTTYPILVSDTPNEKYFKPIDVYWHDTKCSIVREEYMPFWKFAADNLTSKNIDYSVEEGRYRDSYYRFKEYCSRDIIDYADTKLDKITEEIIDRAVKHRLSKQDISGAMVCACKNGSLSWVKKIFDKPKFAWTPTYFYLALLYDYICDFFLEHDIVRKSNLSSIFEHAIYFEDNKLLSKLFELCVWNSKMIEELVAQVSQTHQISENTKNIINEALFSLDSDNYHKNIIS